MSLWRPLLSFRPLIFCKATTSNTLIRPSLRHAPSTTLTTRLYATRTSTSTVPFAPLPLILITSAITCLAVGIYQYKTSAIQKYPLPIRQSLRRAVYYENYGKDPVLAESYYRKALDGATTSPELEAEPAHISGIMIRLGTLLDSLGKTHEAIDVLNHAFRLVIDPNTPASALSSSVPLANVTARHLPPSERIKSIGLAQKLGDLYAAVGQDERAEAYYVWSVEQMIVESGDGSRETKFVVDPNQTFDFESLPKWMTKTDLGASLEALGAFYASRRKHSLALPLYLRSLSLLPYATSCRGAVLMCNLAEAHAAMGHLEEARRWAEKGREIADDPNVKKRASKDKISGDNPRECDEACAVLLVNLGMVHELSGDTIKAVGYYERARDHSRQVRFADGVREAEARLRRLRVSRVAGMDERGDVDAFGVPRKKVEGS